MTNIVKAWQCIGCGKIEAPQTWIGICQDRKVEFVYAAEHEETLASLSAALASIEALEAVAYQLAWTKPRIDEWEHSYRALQQRARRVLASITSLRRDSRQRNGTDRPVVRVQSMEP
jgi:hypothetical protein